MPRKMTKTVCPKCAGETRQAKRGHKQDETPALVKILCINRKCNWWGYTPGKPK